MKILVTGANGFLGRHIVERLLITDHDVAVTIRPAARAPDWPDRVVVHRIDLRAPAGLKAALEDVDMVIHVAAATDGSEDMQFAATVGGTEKLFSEMKAAKTPRLVLISSFVVYDWRKVPSTLDEECPLDSDIYAMGAYAIAKFWQERITRRFAAETECSTTIFRPGYIWGEDHAEFAGMGRQVGPAYLVFGPLTRLPTTHVTNCADAVVASVDKNLPTGTTFNVVDGHRISAWRYTGQYLKRAGVRAWRVPVPYWLVMSIAQLASLWSRRSFSGRGQLPSFLEPRKIEAQCKPVRISMNRLEQLLNWHAPNDYKACLDLTHGPKSSRKKIADG